MGSGVEEALVHGFAVALGLCATLWYRRSSRTVSGYNTTRGGGYRFSMPEGIKSIDPQDPYTMYVDFDIRWRTDPDEVMHAHKLRLMPSQTGYLLLISLDKMIPHDEIDYGALKGTIIRTLEDKAGLPLRARSFLQTHDVRFVHDEDPNLDGTPIRFELAERWRTLILDITMAYGSRTDPERGDTFVGAWNVAVQHHLAEHRANQTLKRTIRDTYSEHVKYLGHPEHPVKLKEYIDMGGIRRPSKRVALKKADLAKKKRGEEPLPLAGLGANDHAITEQEKALATLNARRKRHGREPVPWTPKLANLDKVLEHWRREYDREERYALEYIDRVSVIREEYKNGQDAIAGHLLKRCNANTTKRIALAWHKYMSALQSVFGGAGVDESGHIKNVVAQFIDIHWIGLSGDSDRYEDSERLVPTDLKAIFALQDELWNMIGECVHEDTDAKELHWYIKFVISGESATDTEDDNYYHYATDSTLSPVHMAVLHMAVFASDTKIGQALRSLCRVRGPGNP